MNEETKEEIEVKEEESKTTEETEEKAEENKSTEETEVKAVESETKEPTKKKKSTIILIVAICISVAIVAMIVGIVFIKVHNEFSKKETKVEVDKPVFKSNYRLSGNGLEDFDLYFLQLENKQVNTVYSPLSIKYALAMLNEGTDGDSHKQIEAVIGDYKAKKYNNNEHMSFANAMFIRNTFKDNIKEDYTKKLQDSYGAEVIIDPFENASQMNSWVGNKTFNLINDLLDDETVQQENFVLINALAIDMNWVNRLQRATAPLPEGMDQKNYNVSYQHEKYSDWVSTIQNEDYPAMTFDGQDNIKSVEIAGSFNHYDIVKEVGEENIRTTITDGYTKHLEEHPGEVEYCPTVEEYVNQYIQEIDSNYKQEAVSTDFSIYVDDDIKLFAKDLQTYEGTTLQYIGIMPQNESLNSYIKDLKAKDLNTKINQLKEVKYDSFKEGVITQVRGNIPLFKYDYKLELIKDLQSLGIKDVFNMKQANLSKMLTDKEKQYIDNATHKATIEFSNDGIKAAAATSMSGAGAASACTYDYLYEVPVEIIDITFDKPYMYLIRDKGTGEVWFAGTVYEPTKK